MIKHEIETMSWRLLTGNKFNRSLDPAMCSDEGCIKQSSVRRTGDAIKKPFLVTYDRDYLVEWIGRSICRPLFIFGKQKVLELVDEAWENYYNSDESAIARTANRN